MGIETSNELTDSGLAFASQAGVAPAVPTREARDGEPLAVDRRVRIILDETDEIPPGGQFIGVNGTGYLLQAGVEVDVPLFVLEVLNNAIQTKANVDANNKVIGYRNVSRFPYRLVMKDV